MLQDLWGIVFGLIYKDHFVDFFWFLVTFCVYLMLINVFCAVNWPICTTLFSDAPKEVSLFYANLD